MRHGRFGRILLVPSLLAVAGLALAQPPRQTSKPPAQAEVPDDKNKIDAEEERDRAVAERVHATVTATAPELSPRTWYGMPAYANTEGKIVVCFKNSGKFSTRYSTLEFQDSANLDDGDLWPVSFALHEWSPAVEQKVAGLIKAAVS